MPVGGPSLLCAAKVESIEYAAWMLPAHGTRCVVGTTKTSDNSGAVCLTAPNVALRHSHLHVVFKLHKATTALAHHQLLAASSTSLGKSIPSP